MQPRIISTILIAACALSLMYLACQGLMFTKKFLHEKTEETTRDITEKLLKNLSNSFVNSPSMEVQESHINPTFCKPGKGSDCVMPFEFFIAKYRIAPKYNLNACVIEKSMSTVLAGIMCYLFDPVGFKAANRTISSDPYHTRFCKGRNEYSTIKGFTDKCIMEATQRKRPCYGCGGNFSCFVEKQYQRQMNYVTGKNRFIGYEDIHFSPQTWYCSFRHKFNKFHIIRYTSNEEEMLHNLLEHLRKSGVEKKYLDVIKKDITSTKTPHTTKSLTDRKILEKQIRSHPRVMYLLMKMFYYDFALFGFKLPVLP